MSEFVSQSDHGDDSCSFLLARMSHAQKTLARTFSNRTVVVAPPLFDQHAEGEPSLFFFPSPFNSRDRTLCGILFTTFGYLYPVA